MHDEINTAVENSEQGEYQKQIFVWPDIRTRVSINDVDLKKIDHYCCDANYLKFVLVK